MSHDDIRIGTLAGMDKGAGYISQMLPHGFESFSLTLWQHIGAIDLQRTAREVLETIDGQAVVSSIGLYGNPLTDQQTQADWQRLIDSAPLFNTDLLVGFAGALPGVAVPDTIETFKKVWTPLVRRAQDKGLRIAFENCDMGGWWHDSGGFNIAHAPSTWELMFEAIDSPALGLQWEPCHQMVSLIDPIPQLRQWAAAGKIFNVHGKDATVAWDVVRTYGIRGGKTYVWHRTPGFGDSNWADIISILRMNGYRGSIDIEGWHDPVYAQELEMTGQVHALNYLKNCRGGAFVPNPK